MTDVNFPQDFYLDDVGVWRLKKEKLAELNKPKPMTNEEYLRSCTNEELQWVLWHIRYDRESPWAGKLIDDWLKQPHSEVAE